MGKGLGQLTKVIQEDSSSLDNIMRSYEEHSSIY